MVLTGPNSYPEEPGIEEATLVRDTFTVPPVDSHSGNDYGTTSNGISFSRELTPGVYTSRCSTIHTA